MGYEDVTQTLVDRGWVTPDQAQETEDALRAPATTEEVVVFEPPGKIIAGRYEIIQSLAHGGMGSVYIASQIDLGRRVAVKVVAEEDPELLERFRREAMALADVSHPGIVEIYDFIRDAPDSPGRSYLVMTFIDGQDLESYIQAQPAQRLTPAEAVELVLPVVSAIVELHANGIIHRDLKPANLVRFLRADGHPSSKLVDFGISRRAVDEGLTATGSVLGTPSYIAPEAMFGRGHTPLSDVYSLGATIFELVKGAPPFGTGAPVDIIKNLIAHQVALPPDVQGTPLGELIERMLAMEPDGRPTALQVYQALERIHLGFQQGADTGPSEPARSTDAPVAGSPASPPAEPFVPASEPAPAAPPEPSPELIRVGDHTDPVVPLDAGLLPQPSRGGRGVLVVLVAAVVLLLGGLIFVAWQWRGAAVRADAAEAREPTDHAAPAARPAPRPEARPGRRVPARPETRPEPRAREVAPRDARPASPADAAVPAERPAPRPAVAPAVLRLKEACRTRRDGQRLYGRARHAGKKASRRAFAEAAYQALLLSDCADRRLRRNAARNLAILLIRDGRCDRARGAWTTYQGLARARRGRPPRMPACRPR